MSRTPLPRLTGAVSAATASALILTATVVPDALAQSSSSSGLSSELSSSSGPSVDNSAPPQKRASQPYTMPDGTVVQIMDDVAGKHSRHVGLGATDLGTMAPLGGGEFAMIFGDSFSGQRFGEGDWMSPVGVVARMNEDGFIEIIRPLNRGERVEQTVGYLHEDKLTLIPSDVINLDGTLYMQAMWNRGIGNVDETEIFKSTDGGKSWSSIGTTPADYMSGMGNLISWEKGPDGYIYVVSTQFKRDDPVYLSRFREQDIADRSKWQLFDPASGKWGDSGAPILSGSNIEAGEMNLRYIQGKWVLVMFNEATLAIEVRISDTLAQDWADVPVATVAKHGPWSNAQTPGNFSQPYGGYIVPGSTIADMDIVVSQWNTDTHARYMSTQFNVKGLDKFFGINSAALPADETLAVTERPAAQVIPETQAEDSLVEQKPQRMTLSSESNDSATTAVIVLSILAVLGGVATVALPTVRPLLPPQVQQMLPF